MLPGIAVYKPGLPAPLPSHFEKCVMCICHPICVYLIIYCIWICLTWQLIFFIVIVIVIFLKGEPRLVYLLWCRWSIILYHFCRWYRIFAHYESVSFVTKYQREFSLWNSLPYFKLKSKENVQIDPKICIIYEIYQTKKQIILCFALFLCGFVSAFGGLKRSTQPIFQGLLTALVENKH